VDFIIEAMNRCIAIEIRAAPRWNKSDLAGLNAILTAAKECMAGILVQYTGADQARREVMGHSAFIAAFLSGWPGKDSKD
jgi:hypothetical protein